MLARAYASPARQLDPEPLSAINITPLIDVMLVLLIMMILSIPAMTNKVPIDLPQSGPSDPKLAVTHIIALDAAGVTTLDGAAVSDAALQTRLTAMRADPNNEYQLRIDGHTRYERADQVFAAIKRADVTRLGFVGNDRFADFDHF